MNKFVVGILAGLLLGGGATWLSLRHSADAAAPKAEAAPAKTEEKPNPLRLTPAQREKAGITLAKPSAVELKPEVQGFGRVLDPSALATIVAEVETARAAMAASDKELERAKKLYAANGNASAQAVETAQAAQARDRATLVSAEARLIAGWGRELAQNPAALTEAIEHGATLVRIDLLPGDIAAAGAKQARVTLPGRTEALTAELLGPAPTADPQVQGLSYLALVRESPLSAGAAFRATLPGTGEAASALAIPRSAVVYHQGSAWIFVLGEEDTFERKIVSLGQPAGPDSIAILSGLEPDEQVAATGAQQLLAAELQAGQTEEEP
jgi:hypothetical protein